MESLKKAIKDNSLKIDLGVFDTGAFDPSCIFCTVTCTGACSVGCSWSSAAKGSAPDKTA
ncbi:MAG: hypothetical protein ACM3SY_05605 [Candidatus Omnitrophota bacterium]